MEAPIDTQEEFSILKRAKSFTHASRGVALFFKTTHNAWIEITLFIIAIILGIYFDISSIEWAMLILASGLVFVSEAFNTAIEIDINLTSPDMHPYARDTKDVSAGAVLIASITALAIGLFLFLPYIF